MTAPIGIYDRVSRKGDREDDRFHSPREQRERATGLVIAKGLTPDPRVFSDIDVSGATHPDERPAMRELLTLIEAGELGGVAAYSLDRLSREPAHGDELVRRVTRAGGIILTPDIPEAIDSPTGEFTFGMLLQVAKLYRSQAGARFATAKERAILAGIPVGRVPYGYRQREDRRLERDPHDAPIVHELYERRAGGDGYTPLANLLEERGGRAWTRQGVAALLRNRLYATGRLEYGDLVSEWDAGAIVDEPLWHAAQSPHPRPRPPRDPEARWLLSGLLRCGSCTHSMTPWRSAGGKYRRYRCVNRKCPARVSVDAERMEAWVVLRSFALSDEVVTRSESVDLAPLEAAVEEAERRVEQVMAPGAADDLGELWAPEVRRRREARDEALTRLGEARRDEGTEAREVRLSEVWEGLSPHDRREALALYWREIRVGRRGDDGTPITLVARGPRAEAEVSLP